MDGQPPDSTNVELVGADGGPLLPNRLEIHSSAWIAPGVIVVGSVALAEHASVWYGCVLRGDMEPIRIGSGILSKHPSRRGRS